MSPPPDGGSDRVQPPAHLFSLRPCLLSCERPRLSSSSQTSYFSSISVYFRSGIFSSSIYIQFFNVSVTVVLRSVSGASSVWGDCIPSLPRIVLCLGPTRSFRAACPACLCEFCRSSARCDVPPGRTAVSSASRGGSHFRSQGPGRPSLAWSPPCRVPPACSPPARPPLGFLMTAPCSPSPGGWGGGRRGLELSVLDFPSRRDGQEVCSARKCLFAGSAPAFLCDLNGKCP